MTRRAEITALLVTDSAVYRADGDLRLRSLEESSLPGDDRFDGSTVQAARLLAESSRPAGRQVMIFSTDVWNQVVGLPRQGASSLADEDLPGALTWEVETLSGIEADDCSLAAVETGGSPGTRLVLDQCILPRSGTPFWKPWDSGVRSVTLMHPAAAGTAAGGEKNPWRLEAWGTTLAIRGRTGECLAVQQAQNDAAGLEAAFRLVAPDDVAWQDVQVTLEPGKDLPGLGQFGGTVVRLDDPAARQQWWRDSIAQVRDAGADSFPRLVHHPAGKPLLRSWLAQAAVALVLAGLCLTHYWWLGTVRIGMRNEIEEVQRPAREKQQYDAMLQTALDKRTEALQQAARLRVDLRKVQFLFGKQTVRIEELLTLLARLRSSELVIDRIAPDPRGLVVSGVSINGDAAPLMANRLRDLAAPMGWKIHPASQVGEQKMTSGGPWLFTVLLEDVGPPDLAPVPADANGRSRMVADRLARDNVPAPGTGKGSPP